MRGRRLVPIILIAFVVLVGVGSTMLWSAFLSVGGTVGEVPGSESEALELGGTGTYLVGHDIPAGVYRTETAGSGCNWSLVTGGVAVGSGEGEGELVVTIQPSHNLFRTSGCGKWRQLAGLIR